MKTRLLLGLLLLSCCAAHAQSQLAYNTKNNATSHSATTFSKNAKKKNKERKMTTQFVDFTNVPDSISKKTDLASQRILKLFLVGLGKKPADSTYDLHTWSSYKSKVIGSTAQVRIDMTCSLVHNKNPRKPPMATYTINYQADVNIFRINYDSHNRKTKIQYNESHWPGFMHSDKTPAKADLDNDISLFLDHIIKDDIVLH